MFANDCTQIRGLLLALKERLLNQQAICHCVQTPLNALAGSSLLCLREGDDRLDSWAVLPVKTVLLTIPCLSLLHAGLL